MVVILKRYLPLYLNDDSHYIMKTEVFSRERLRERLPPPILLFLMLECVVDNVVFNEVRKRYGQARSAFHFALDGVHRTFVACPATA